MFRFLRWVLGITIIVGGLLYAFVLDVWTVPSDDALLAASIAPNLEPGDVVVMTRHPAMTHGYLVRCADPETPGRFVIGRAIARGGEQVSFDSEIVGIDGHHTPSGHACETEKTVIFDPNSNSDVELVCAVEEYGEADFSVLMSRINPLPATKAMVEPGTWFLVSDNRHIHEDSRDFGGVDPRTCQHLVSRVMGAAGLGVRLLW